jgi:hypothetical protein
MKVDFQFENTQLGDILSFFRDVSGLNFVLDPSLDPGIVKEFKVQNMTLRSALDILCAVKGLDFDFRYKVVFLSTPMRIWSTDPKVGLPSANHWTKQTSAPGDAAVGDKLRAILFTIDMQNAPMSSISGIKFKAEPAIAGQPIRLKAGDLTLNHVLELLTLPLGWDARIDNGTVVIFDPKRN